MNETFYSVEAEQFVLGAVLMDPVEVLDRLYLNPSDYYLPEHKLIVEAIQKLQKANEPIELFSVINQLAETNKIDRVGGASYLVQLSGSIASTVSVSFYEGIVKKHAKKRLIQKTLQEAQMKLLETETDEDVDNLSYSIVEVLNNTENQTDAGFTHIKDVMYEVVEQAEQRRDEVIGVSSGFPDLDKMLSGFKPGELVIVGARPSMGKSAFMLNIANNAAKNGALIPLYSLEMSNVSLGQRILSSEAQINSRNIKIGANALTDDNWKRIMHEAGLISNTDILFNDKSGITVHEIRRDLTKLRKNNPDREILCFIDYLQLIKGDAKHKGNRTQEISEISRSLKTAALDLNLTIVALSQLSRAVEQRQDKHPMMSDIRESGSIEQDADVIMFLYRESYYDQEAVDNIIECIISKQRDGAIGTVELAFVKEYGRFLTLERRFEQ